MKVKACRIAISIEAYERAKVKAKEEDKSMSKWVSEAVLEKIVLDDLVECKKLEEDFY